MDLKGNSRSTVKFQFHASGFLKFLLWVVTTSGTLLVPPPPGLSAIPLVTLAFGWNGGLPPRKIESLTPSRVMNRPAPARTTVLLFSWYATPNRGWISPHWTSE